VAHVAEKVEKLTVRDKEKEVESTTDSVAKITINNKTSTATAATSIINNISIDNQATMTVINNMATATSTDGSITNNKAGTETPNPDNTSSKEGVVVKVATEEKPNNCKPKQWKRTSRDDKIIHAVVSEAHAENTSKHMPLGLGLSLGKRTWDKEELEDDTANGSTGRKKTKGEEVATTLKLTVGDHGTEEDSEATSPGAAGQLTGAKVGACQEP
jgi:hypothetical protein